MTDNFLQVEAYLKINKDNRSWVVDKCPFCGKRHIHGAGNLDADPDFYLGIQDSHCCGKFKKQKYNLIKVENVEKTGKD